MARFSIESSCKLTRENNTQQKRWLRHVDAANKRKHVSHLWLCLCDMAEYPFAVEWINR